MFKPAFVSSTWALVPTIQRLVEFPAEQFLTVLTFALRRVTARGGLAFTLVVATVGSGTPTSRRRFHLGMPTGKALASAFILDFSAKQPKANPKFQVKPTEEDSHARIRSGGPTRDSQT